MQVSNDMNMNSEGSLTWARCSAAGRQTASWPTQQSSHMQSPSHFFNSQATSPTSRHLEQKRPYSNTSGVQRNLNSRPKAPPAVPEFGTSFPAKPSIDRFAVPKPKKKKRKHNQLGLTPMTEDHESSENEDLDEEASFANGPQNGMGMAPAEYENMLDLV